MGYCISATVYYGMIDINDQLQLFRVQMFFFFFSFWQVTHLV